MDGTLLRFYIHEAHWHRGMLVWEWLLKQASELGVRGGSAFRAMAGFGRHHVLHEQGFFFDLRGSVTVEVEFIASEAEAHALLQLLREARLRIFYASIPAQFTIINPDHEDLLDRSEPHRFARTVP